MFIKFFNRIVDIFFTRRKTKTLAWKLWYPYVTRRLKKEDVLFLNYAFVEESQDTSHLALEADDEKNRACISLYHHLAQRVDLKGKSVLEVSCGHGGGASFISRYHQPRHLTAVDLNREGIGFCKKRHPLSNLDFLVANAENLPLPGNTFDAVVNVEASHAYGDFPAFVKEVRRVLKPKGHFLYADFRSKNQLDEWESDLVREDFQLVHSQDITEQVVRSMEQNSERSDKLVVDQLPFYLRFIGRVFAGIKGTRIFNAMKKKDLVYHSYHFVRSAN